MTDIQKTIRKLWSTVAVGGVAGIIFGLIAMLWPHLTLSFFIYLFSIFILVVSVIVLGQSFTNIQANRLWWLSMIFAICGISIGLFILLNPSVAQAVLAILLAVYIFSQSLLDLVVASYSDDRNTKAPVIIIGILGVIFGFIVLLYPRLATEAMVWVVGLYVLVHSIVIEYYAFRVRSQAKQLHEAIVSTSGHKTKKTKSTHKKTSK